MKFRNPGRTALAAFVLTAQTLIMTACSSNTIDFLYVASSKQSPGQIDVYEVDHLSGVLRPRTTSYTTGNNPFAMVASPDGSNLYVVNKGDNTVQQFAVSSDGTLTSKGTITTPGTVPVAIAIDPTQRYLYVVDTYQPGYSSSSPGPGALVIISLDASGKLGSVVANGGLNYWPVGNTPSAVAVVETNSYPTTTCGTSATPANTTTYSTYVYVTAINPSTINSPTFIPAGGAVYTFSGLLTSTSCGSAKSTATISSFAATSPALIAAGTLPSAVVAEPRGRFVYVTDKTQNQMYGYSIYGNNILQRMTSSPYKTGVLPTAITVDPRGLYLLLSNYTDSTVSSYAIDPTTGIPSAAFSATVFTGTGPVSLQIEPALGRFVYSANFVDGSISGIKLDPSTGSLSTNQNSPYPSGGAPTAIAIVTHGDHPTESLAP